MNGLRPATLLALAFFMAAVAAAPLEKARTFRVTAIEGRVESGRVRLSVGDRLTAGASVRTSDSASVVMKAPGRAAVKLGAKSAMTICESGDTINLQLKRGSILAVVSRGKGAFSLSTPTAVAGVRGTAFYVEALGRDRTYVCLCEGALWLATRDTACEIRSADRSHHTPVMITKDSSGRLTPAPAPMLHHTNEDIEALSGSATPQ